MLSFRRIRPLLAFVAVAAALVLVIADANARAGGGFSSGSRGSRTFTAPPSTTTAPNAAAPTQRTITQPGKSTAGAPAAASGGLFGGFFNRPGLLGGLAAGFLGAGLFGLLFGHGLFGGLGGLGSIFGLLIQLALIGGVAWLIWTWWQRRHAPAYAAAGVSPLHRDTTQTYGFGGGGGPSPAPAGGPIAIEQADYEAFERLLGEIQTAYAAEDLNALRVRATPEMVSYFADDLSKLASRGLANKVSDVKLEQGDLAEAWREGDVEHATVAMRFSLIDYEVDRTTGRVVEGDPNRRSEATELWTFMRTHGGSWILSAIQQTT